MQYKSQILTVTKNGMGALVICYDYSFNKVHCHICYKNSETVKTTSQSEPKPIRKRLFSIAMQRDFVELKIFLRYTPLPSQTDKG